MTAIPMQASSIYSSSSDASLDPKVPNIVSTLPMGSQKPIDFIPGSIELFYKYVQNNA